MKNYYKLLSLLGKIRGAQFFTLDALTQVELAGGRKNPFQGRVTKLVTGLNVIAYQNKIMNGYENMVMKRLGLEGKDPFTFVLSSRSWGERIPNSPFVYHKGEYYLEVICLHVGAVMWMVDGVPTFKECIPGIITKQEARQGGLREKVILRDYKCDSIFGITINHSYFQVGR